MSIRKNIVIEQEDQDILDFFLKKGMDGSTVFRLAVRQYYEWFAAAAATGERAFLEERRQRVRNMMTDDDLPVRDDSDPPEESA